MSGRIGAAVSRHGRILGAVATLLLAAAILLLLSASERRAAPVPDAATQATFDRREQAAIEDIVRAYLLQHPEIIPAAITRLQEREVAKLLESNREEIETPFAGAYAGNPEGDVTLVEFFDYACPYCRSAHADVQRLLAEDERLKVVYRDFPVLSETSSEAALASLSAARQGRYRPFHDRLFEEPGKLTHEKVIATVRRAGLDEYRTATDMRSAEIRAEVEHNHELARALGVTGTPTYVIGNRILSGAVGYEQLKQAVAEARTPGP